MSLRPPDRAYVTFQVVTSLRDAIQKGEWKDRLPSERVLAGLLKVSRMTVRKAMAHLEAEGLIAPNPGNAQRRLLREPAAAVVGPEVTVSIVRRPDPLAVTDLDLWQHRLQLRLAHLGIRSDVLFFTNRQMHSKRYDPRNWITGRTRRFWLLVGSSADMQHWFVKHAPGQTLVLGSTSPQSDLPSIDRDYRAVGRHAGGILLGRRHRIVALLGRKQPVIGDRETEEGLREALLRNSDARLHIARHDGSQRDLYRQLDQLLRIKPRPTVLFVYKAPATLAALIHLLHRGVRIPENLSVIARDESPWLEALPFDLTHYRIRPDEIVDRVTTRIQQYLESPSTPLSSARILSQFHDGSTVATLASE